MSKVSTYLNFPGTTEEAFKFYESVFGGKINPDIARFGNMPEIPGMPPLEEKDKNAVMHIELEIMGGHKIMGTDALPGMGFTVKPGNNIYINLEVDTREETKRLFDGLSAMGTITQPLEEAFWGAYFGSCVDKYGINWMFNCEEKK